MIKRKTLKNWAVLSIMTCLCLNLAPAKVLAASPEFAYSAEKWASLRDDKLEYDEIADLIHEYNSTVIQNQIDYKEYNGEDRDDVSQDYYDTAEEIYANLEYPDTDDSNYGSQMAAALNSKLQADDLVEQGDDNVDDGEVVKLGYDQVEAGLVQQAQKLMVTYWSQTDSLESLKKSKTQAEADYQAELVRLGAGTSTQAQVLSAKTAVSTAEASILSAENSLETTRQNLCQMLGWTYGSNVEIGELPEPDLTAEESTDLNTDVQKALDNSYSLKITQKKLANAHSDTVKSTLEETLKNQRESTSTSVKSAWQDLTLAKSNYEQAVLAYENTQTALQTAERQLQAGTITRNSYQNSQTASQTAEVTVNTRKLSYLTAQIDYEWAVKGLASAA